MQELDDLLKKGDSQAILKYLRHNRVRASNEAVQHGRDFVMKGTGSRLGDEAWPVYEQVFLAALDLGETLLAQTALGLLEKQFPGSARVGRLAGMQAEAEGDFESATALYKDLREAHPANPVVWKRWISLAKAQGNLPEAIKRCNEYLRVFQADTNAWQELADLYKRTGHPHEAAFCYEELILCSPANFAFHAALGEVYVAVAGADSLRLARKHFARALELHGGENLRALYGMCSTCLAIATEGRKEDKVDAPVNAALFTFAADKIKAHYSRVNPSLLSVVEAALQQQKASITKTT